MAFTTTGTANRKSQLLLLLYLAAIVTVTCIHDPGILAIGLLLVMALAGRECPGILKRSLLVILLFNSIVTVSYTVSALMQKSFSAQYVLLFNLRVLLLTSSTVLFQRRVNPFAALSFSPTLLYLLTIAYSQSLTFKRLLRDFRLAHRSRSPRRPGLGDLYRNGAAAGYFFINKSLISATEITQAMTSRGFFNDQD